MHSNSTSSFSSFPQKNSIFPLLLLLFSLICLANSSPLNAANELANLAITRDELSLGLTPADELWASSSNQNQRQKRAIISVNRRLSLASAENGGYPYRNRYYVSRWHRRRFVPPAGTQRDEDEDQTMEMGYNASPEVRDKFLSELNLPIFQQNSPQRLCGIKLTNRTRELCGDCAPANMQRVHLADKKADKVVVTKERLTQMCCEKRCTDEQIRDYCCRA